ncbi:quinolinate synthase NadA [bacterium]|nr:quinolinate synthase NadA [bacterium]MBU1072438.1 quinolinate synthase NadA [bacterium]MBU1675452.1 quinolinate synthase NadA [bacterium]
MSEQNPGRIDPRLDLCEAIDDLRRDLNAVILAHYYQESEIQDLADFVGDSLALSQQAARTDAEVIVFAGVHFMAETAKILNPDKQVLLPDLAAGCSLADGCPAGEFAAFLARYPGHAVISYINCSLETKAMSDIICTSSNAVKIVGSLPADRPVVFAPDRHLGAWVSRKLGRDLVLWPGSCEVHEQFSERKLVELKVAHPEAVVAAHPECTEALLQHADHVGSTSAILKFTRETGAREVIVLTEPGIIHQMRKENPDKEFFTVPGADETCNCNECPYMKLNTLEKLYLCMRDRSPEIVLDETLRLRALRPIERMLALS